MIISLSTPSEYKEVKRIGIFVILEYSEITPEMNDSSTKSEQRPKSKTKIFPQASLMIGNQTIVKYLNKIPIK